jgi:hypothetical protein
VNIPDLLIDNDSDPYNDVLKGTIWQKAAYYDLSTASIFWNRATLFCLPKVLASTPLLALICLLQKEAKTLSVWQEQWGDRIPTAREFIKAVIAGGRFSNTKGEAIPIESFWKQYEGTMAGVAEEPSFEFSVDGIVAPYNDLLLKKDIQRVICFDNNWNEQNFLIETSTEWILFHWGTMA